MTTKTTHWSDALPKSACREAVEWARTQPSYEAAWAACKRGDWMLWIVGYLETSEPWSEERKPLVRCTIDCARTFTDSMPQASKDALDVIERWCDGKATLDEAKAARRAAYAACACAYAADAAAYTVAAVYAAAAYAAYAAADAAADAAAAAAASYAAAARRKVLAQTADIVRSHYPKPPVLK